MMTTRPRPITVIALLIAWLSVSLVFFSLSRPVQEWAGEGWIWFPVVAAFTLLFGWLAAYALWAGRRWTLFALNLWTGSVVAGALMLVVGSDAVNLGTTAGLGVLVVALAALTGWVKRVTRPGEAP